LLVGSECLHPLETVRAGDEDALAAARRNGRDPGFAGVGHVLARATFGRPRR
jgi:hypothetical protein